MAQKIKWSFLKILKIELPYNPKIPGTSLVVQWLRLRAPNAGGPGSIPGQGTTSCMSQLKDPASLNEDPTHIHEDPACCN